MGHPLQPLRSTATHPTPPKGLELIIGMMGQRHTSRSMSQCTPCQKRMPAFSGGHFKRETLSLRDDSNISTFLNTRHLPSLAQGDNPLGICVRISTTKLMIEMKGDERLSRRVCQAFQDMQQHDRIQAP